MIRSNSLLQIGAAIVLCSLLTNCKKNSETVTTSNIKMEVAAISQSGENSTSVRIRMIDYTNGGPSYLTLPTWLGLSGKDKLVVTANGEEYSFNEFDDGNGIYSFSIDAASPDKLGVELRRAKGVDARTGSAELIYNLSLDQPATGTLFQSSDTIEAVWSLNSMPPTKAVAEKQLRSSVRLTSCQDASGNVVLGPDEDRIPAPPFGNSRLSTGRFSTTGQELLNLAIGPDVLDAAPNAVSCKIQLSVYTDSFRTETGTDAIVDVYVDPALAKQYWTIRNKSNIVELTVLR